MTGKHLAVVVWVAFRVASADPEPPALDAQTVAAIVRRYHEQTRWGGRAVAILALGPRWHPDGSQIVADALAARDRRLKAFALDALRQCDPAWRTVCFTPLVIDGLVELLDDEPGLLRDQATQLLVMVAPFIATESHETLRAWWRAERSTYQVRALPGRIAASGSVEVAYRAERIARVERQALLQAHGLQVVFCIDTSGSMQPAIAAARQACRDILELLAALAPTLRVGLVHYKDAYALPTEAELLMPLTRETARFEALLSRLRAEGGGQREEPVDVALELALGKHVGWSDEGVRLVVIIGDAPPQADRLQRMYNLARQARYGIAPNPTEISTIDAGQASDTQQIFSELADQGGGAYQRLARAAAGSVPETPLRDQVVRLVFGKSGQELADRFLAILQENAAREQR
jgi:Mg-chelatase subunit ChlD